jgi:STE24 endopeptidase
VDSTRDFSAAEIGREEAFHRAVRPPAFAGLGVGLLVALLLGLTPLGARLVAAAAAPLGGGWWQRVLVGGLAVAIVTRAVTLPFDARSEVVLRRYGLSTRRGAPGGSTRRRASASRPGCCSWCCSPCTG